MDEAGQGFPRELTCSINSQFAHASSQLLETCTIEMTIKLTTEALLRVWCVRFDFAMVKGNPKLLRLSKATVQVIAMIGTWNEIQNF